MQVWYPLDSSLPAAVRMSFLLFASFAAAGGKARKQLHGGVAAGGKLELHTGVAAGGKARKQLHGGSCHKGEEI